jgi:hypothetical protein
MKTKKKKSKSKITVDDIYKEDLRHFHKEIVRPSLKIHKSKKTYNRKTKHKSKIEC